jgi:hypothetical protein
VGGAGGEGEEGECECGCGCGCGDEGAGAVGGDVHFTFSCARYLVTQITYNVNYTSSMLELGLAAGKFRQKCD